MLYDPTRLGPYRKGLPIADYMESAVVALIIFSPVKRHLYWVGFVAARHGHGPTIYELAFETARREGSEVMPGEATSAEAKEIWRRFSERSNVVMHELPLELRGNEASYLDVSAAMSRPLRGFDAAKHRGDAFVQKLRRQSGLKQKDVLKGIAMAGDRLYELMERERETNPAEVLATKARMLAY